MHIVCNIKLKFSYPVQLHKVDIRHDMPFKAIIIHILTIVVIVVVSVPTITSNFKVDLRHEIDLHKPFSAMSRYEPEVVFKHHIFSIG